jgi:hypothetical protein
LIYSITIYLSFYKKKRIGSTRRQAGYNVLTKKSSYDLATHKGSQIGGGSIDVPSGFAGRVVGLWMDSPLHKSSILTTWDTYAAVAVYGYVDSDGETRTSIIVDFSRFDFADTNYPEEMTDAPESMWTQILNATTVK